MQNGPAGIKDTSLINEWIEQARKIRKSGEPDSAIQLLKKAATWSDQLNYRKGKGYALLHTASSYRDLGNYQQALDCYGQSMSIAKKDGNKRLLASNYNDKGLTLQYMGKYIEALENHYASLKIKEEQKDSVGIAASLTNIASVYDDQRNYEKALEMHFKCIALKKAIGKEPSLAISYSNLAGVYLAQEKYDEAKKYMLLALDIEKKYDNKKDIAASYSNLGLLYMGMEDYKKALEYELLALRLKREMGSKGAMQISLINLGSIYLHIHKPLEAEKQLKQALALAEEIDNLDGIQDAHRLLARTYDMLNRPDAAYRHYKSYIESRDSLFSEENIRETERLALNYEFEKKQLQEKALQEKRHAIAQEELKIKELQLGRNRLLLFVLIGLVVVVVIITVLLIRQSRYKAQQRNMQLEQQLLRSQMNPHFIFNALNSVQTYILEKDPRQASDYLARFSRLIRLVLNNTKEKELTLEKEIELLKAYVEMEEIRFEHKFDVEFIVNKNVDTYELRIPPMLVQPYIENAIWHGLMPLRNTDKRGKLKIEFSVYNENLHIVIEDNGIGMETSMKIKKTPEHNSLGMSLTESRVKAKNNASVRIDNLHDEDGTPTGTRVEIILPVN